MKLALFLFLSGMAHAQTIQKMDLQAFDQAVSSAAPGTIQYAETVKVPSFDEWKAQYAIEAYMLGPYNGYQEPRVDFLKDKKNPEGKIPLHVYMAKSRTVINRPSASLPLADLIKPENVGKFDPSLKIKVISQADLMPTLGGRKNITNFDWCGLGVQLPKVERSLTYLNPPPSVRGGWCSGGDRSTCIESCYSYSEPIQEAIKAENILRALLFKQKKDLASALQAEARYFVSEAEYGSKAPLSQLTRLNTQVRGVLELNMFYFNQVLQFAKVLVVFQEHPSNSQQTIANTYVAIGVRTKYWNHFAAGRDVRDTMRGLGGRLNTKQGLGAGVPVFTQDMTKALVQLIEK
ncbi:MAG: hypothetical protein AB7F86_05715 [Bdellovibrionales bacterium]